MKIEQDVLVKNQLGLHARPAAMIAKLLESCKSEVTFSYRDQTVDAKSMMNVLLLAAGKNAKIKIHVDGNDAKNTVEKLIKAFGDSFGE